MQQCVTDTPPEIERIRFEMMRQIPFWKKFQLTCELIHLTRMLMVSDLRRRFPLASEEEIRRRFIARVLTRDEVMKAYGFDPDTEGFVKTSKS
jgi:hypothetical protein